MTRPKQIDVESARIKFAYCPEVGGSCLVRIADDGTKGEVPSGGKRNGYWYVRMNGKCYPAHRVIWAIVTGEDAPCQIDHVNGKEAGNRIENLRLAPRGQRDNTQNTVRYKNNTSGFPGVGWDVGHKKWRARIKVDGKLRTLGYFNTKQEAYRSYTEHKAKLHTFNPVATRH